MSIDKKILKQFTKDAIRNPFSVFKYSFFRYILIGVLTVVVGFGIFNFISLTSDIHGGAANFIATLISLIFNFSMSYAWTFKVQGKQKIRSLTRYSMLAAFNLSFETFSMYTFIELIESRLIDFLLKSPNVVKFADFILVEMSFYEGTQEGLMQTILRNLLKVIALLMIISWNFVLYKRWVFKKSNDTY